MPAAAIGLASFFIISIYCDLFSRSENFITSIYLTLCKPFVKTNNFYIKRIALLFFKGIVSVPIFLRPVKSKVIFLNIGLVVLVILSLKQNIFLFTFFLDKKSNKKIKTLKINHVNLQ
jgi:hypothetical protein